MLLKLCLGQVWGQKHVIGNKRGEWSSLFDFRIGTVPEQHERTDYGNQGRGIGRFWLALFGRSAREKNFNAVDGERMDFKCDRAGSADSSRAVGVGDRGVHRRFLGNKDGISGGYVLGQDERELIANLQLFRGDVRSENKVDVRVAREQVFSGWLQCDGRWPVGELRCGWEFVLSRGNEAPIQIRACGDGLQRCGFAYGDGAGVALRVDGRRPSVGCVVDDSSSRAGFQAHRDRRIVGASFHGNAGSRRNADKGLRRVRGLLHLLIHLIDCLLIGLLHLLDRLLVCLHGVLHGLLGGLGSSVVLSGDQVRNCEGESKNDQESWHGLCPL
jgi:hypothetical protein